MYRPARTFSILFAFALIAGLNFLGLTLSSNIALSDDGNPTDLPWVAIPYVLSNPQSNTVPSVVAPRFDSTPVETGYVGEPYTYTILTSGHPEPILKLENGPEGMSIVNDALIWTPKVTGAFTVCVSAKNNVQPDAIQEFAVQVQPYWDPDLTTRKAILVEADAQPGELYWQLIRADWLDEYESDGKANIYMELLDDNGDRKQDAFVYVTWGEENYPDEYALVVWEDKPDGEFAWNFPMYSLAPAYNARPVGYPADQVRGMGLGSIENPYYAHHASYELTWFLTKEPDQADPDETEAITNTIASGVDDGG